jgi:hypothetical protein
MNTISRNAAALALALIGITAAAQTTPQTQSNNPTSPAPASSQAPAPQGLGHGAFPVKVMKPLDSSKLKVGDIVEFKTAGAFVLPSGTRVPEGAKVTGHITEANARSKGDSQSVLDVVFDQISLGNGKQLTVKGVIQAIGAAEPEEGPGVANGPSMQNSSGPGGAGWTPTTDIKSGSNMQTMNNELPLLTQKSTGVQGIHGLQLGPDGILTSDGKHVKLDTGVRIIVRGQIME